MSSSNMLNIPEHKNCANCGECCGPVPATEKEIREIAEFMVKNPYVKPIYHKDFLVCPFRSEERKKCLIYPVRPVVCRLFGNVEFLKCPNGNSHNIDGDKFLPPQEERGNSTLLAFVDWEKKKSEVTNGE